MDMTNLDILCNGCNKLMAKMGEWPVQYPTNHTQIAYRYKCETPTCRTPHPDYDKGVPVLIAIISTGVA